MTVAELVAVLRSMPPDARVMHLWEGEARTEINHVWVSRRGEVVTADIDEACYDPFAWPEGAKPFSHGFWRTPRAPACSID